MCSTINGQAHAHFRINQKNTYLLKTSHKLYNDLVFLRRFGNTALTIEILLIVDADIGDKWLRQTQRNTTGDTMALIVVDDQLTQIIVCRIVTGAVAVIAHEIITHQGRNLLDQSCANRDVVAGKTIEGMHIVEGVMRIMLVEILHLGNETTMMESKTSIIHIHCHVGWLDLLSTQHQVDIREKELCLGRIVDTLGPVVLLIGKTRAVEHTGIHHDGETGIPCITYLCTHVTHVTHLLGDKRTVGKILLMGRTVSINGKGNSLLTDGKLAGCSRA